MQQDRRGFLRTALATTGWGVLGACGPSSCKPEPQPPHPQPPSDGQLPPSDGQLPPQDGQAPATDAGSQPPTGRPVRRAINNMTASDPIVVAYKLAITKMKALPASDPRNWTKQAQIHNNHCPHGNWLFLPWHRAYLLYFERICRKLSGMADFALPYWNWSTSPTIPAVFWGGSNPLLDTSRVATASSVASAANIGASVIASINNEPNFLLFGSSNIAASADQRDNAGYGRLEGTPHNYIHGFIGGDMGNFMSPLDPVFWTHHNMIERCWIQRNFANKQPDPNDPAWLGRTFTDFCDENGSPVTVTVSETLLYPVTFYRYDDVGPVGTTGSSLAAVDTPEMLEQNTKVARAGAKVQLTVQKRFAPAQPLAATIEKPAALKIAVDPTTLRSVTSDGNRTLLSFAGLTLDHTEDFSVRVFINKPDASVDTPLTDPHFAGAFAFFNHVIDGHDHGTGGFIIDASDAVKRLNLNTASIDVNVVLVPFPGRQPKTRSLTVATTELRLVKDVVVRSP